MKIAILHFSAPPVVGGVESIVAGQAAVCAAIGHEVTVIAGTGGPVPNATFLRLPTPVDSQPAPGVEDLARFLMGAFRRCDVVFLHNVCTMPFNLPLTEALWQIAQRSDAPRMVAWIHDVAAANPEYDLPWEQDPWRLLKTAHERLEYVAVSERRRQEWAEVCGVAAERCRVIPNGVDAVEALALSERVRRLCQVVRLLERDVVLLHPARLLRRKNISLSLQVTAALREKVNACLLVTAPVDPHRQDWKPYLDELLAERRRLNLETDAVLPMPGFIPWTAAEMAELYRISDALFFPSFQEGFGLPLLEAAMHRVPAFCADIEPLRSLPGALPFSLADSPAQIAAEILRRLDASPAKQARTAALREFSWPAIYRNFLAPLLAHPKMRFTP